MFKNVTQLPLLPDPDSQLRATNEAIAKLAATKPYGDMYTVFAHVAHLATQATAVASELEKVHGIEAGEMERVIQFWCSLAHQARTAALACVGGNQTLAAATVALMFLQASPSRKPAVAEGALPSGQDKAAGQ